MEIARIDEGSRGVRFNEAELGRGEADRMTPQMVAQMAEQLARELDLVHPELPAAEEALIHDALALVLKICRECVTDMGADPAADGELLPIGVYHLGVFLPGDEVDIVYMAPLKISLTDLLENIRGTLWQRPDSKHLCPPGADGLLSAPGLSFTIKGVPVKLLLAQNIPNLPEPRPEALVQNMTGLLARRMSEKLLESVPDQESFRSLLRFVRHWAKNLSVPQLVPCFFRTLSRWDWSQPLDLEDLHECGSKTPHTVAEGPSRINIMLPLGINLSATPYLMDTTTKIMQKELKQSLKMIQQVELGRAHWSDTSAKARFFQRHRHYLELDFMAADREILAHWLSWGRKQMRDLIRLFETMMSGRVTLRLWPNWIEFHDAEWPHARALFVGLHLERNGEVQPEGARRSFDLREMIVKFFEIMSAWPGAHSYPNQFELIIRHLRHADLERWFEEQAKGEVATRTSDVQDRLGQLVPQ